MRREVLLQITKPTCLNLVAARTVRGNRCHLFHPCRLCSTSRRARLPFRQRQFKTVDCSAARFFRRNGWQYPFTALYTSFARREPSDVTLSDVAVLRAKRGTIGQFGM